MAITVDGRRVELVVAGKALDVRADLNPLVEVPGQDSHALTMIGQVTEAPKGCHRYRLANPHTGAFDRRSVWRGPYVSRMAALQILLRTALATVKQAQQAC